MDANANVAAPSHLMPMNTGQLKHHYHHHQLVLPQSSHFWDHYKTMAGPLAK
jgi:hypothetical protein